MPFTFKNKNFAKSTIVAGIADGDLSLVVAPGDGVIFPQTGTFIAVVWSSRYSNPSDDSSREVIHVTSVSVDTFTVVRAREATLANIWPIGSKIAHTITAGKIDELENAIDQKSQLTWEPAYFSYLINNP